MKVKFNSSVRSGGANFEAGQVYELVDNYANAYISLGHAVRYVDDKKAPSNKVADKPKSSAKRTKKPADKPSGGKNVSKAN